MEFSIFSTCLLLLALSVGTADKSLAQCSSCGSRGQGRAEQSGRVTSLDLLSVLLMQPGIPVCFHAVSDHDQLGACQVPLCRAALQPERCLWRQTMEADRC